MKKAIYLCLGLAMTAPAIAVAQDEESKVTMSGFMDAYYFKNLNNPLSGSNLGASGFERAFDQQEGQFRIGMIQTMFTYSNNKSEMVADLTFGPHGDLGNFGNTVGPLGGTTGLAVKQAYFKYYLTSKFSLTLGQFGTHIGYEVIDAPVNYNYSLNNLFTNGPFYHTGLKGTYAFSDKVSLMLGLVNNWDNYNPNLGVFGDNNRYKSLAAQLALAPADGLNIYLNYLGGNENDATPAAGKPAGFNAKDTVKQGLHVLDMVIAYQLTDKFYVGFNGVYGTKTKYKLKDDATSADDLIAGHWGGAAFYTNYQFSSLFSAGARFDIFDNTDGIMYIGATDVKSFTLTPTFHLADGHLLVKPEFRIDMYKKIDVDTGGDPTLDVQQFEDEEGNFTKSSQSTVGLAAIYLF